MRPTVYAEARPEHLRVRLFPQSPLGTDTRLETVALSPRRGTVAPGPSDARIYTIDAPFKRPYGPAGRPMLPPWPGPVSPLPLPSPYGHFDTYRPGDPGFRQVHLYGCVRFALDVWQGYLGGPIDWHFAPHFRRLELVTLGPWPNAHMGYGYLEVGQRPLGDGTFADYALNFDVIGHEIGHGLMMAFSGPFSPGRVTGDYEALHEASADWAAMIASLHFESVLEELLDTARGDLYTRSSLVRFAEFSPTEQIRKAKNRRTMWEFVRGWTSEHDTAEPLIGGLFDAFVEVYKELLVRRGVIPRALDEAAQRAWATGDRSLKDEVRGAFARAYADRPEAFFDAVRDSRTVAATMLIALWKNVDPRGFRLADIIPILLAEDLTQFGGALRPIVVGCLTRRGIGVVPLGPRLRPPGEDSHLHSERTMRPV